MSIWTSSCSQRPNELEHVLLPVLGEGKDHAVGVSALDEVDDLVRRADHLNVADVPAQLPGSASAKPTSSIPYSGCWRTLRAINWPTSPAPTTIARCT